MNLKWTALAATAVLVTGCASADDGHVANNAIGGAALGAIAGAVIGNNVGSGNAATGAAIGAVAGGALGAAKGCNDVGGCGAGGNRQQYYDERAGRYYYYDQRTGRYYWENGAPR
jgi:YmgG-like glycine-zipper protein